MRGMAENYCFRGEIQSWPTIVQITEARRAEVNSRPRLNFTEGEITVNSFSKSQGNSIQILTAQEDDGGNYHSRGAIHTGPTIIPSASPRG